MRPTDQMALILSIGGTGLMAISVVFPPAIGRFTAPLSMVLILLAVFFYCVYGDEKNDDGKKGN